MIRSTLHRVLGNGQERYSVSPQLFVLVQLFLLSLLISSQSQYYINLFCHSQVLAGFQCLNVLIAAYMYLFGPINQYLKLQLVVLYYFLLALQFTTIRTFIGFSHQDQNAAIDLRVKTCIANTCWLCCYLLVFPVSCSQTTRNKFSSIADLFLLCIQYSQIMTNCKSSPCYSFQKFNLYIRPIP